MFVLYIKSVINTRRYGMHAKKWIAIQYILSEITKKKLFVYALQTGRKATLTKLFSCFVASANKF